MDDLSLLKFAQTISSKYSNNEQSYNNPKYFAHINVYFRPLPWSFFKGPGFYSEQSYDCTPWSPYRQSVLRLIGVGEKYILKNYEISNSKRVAGAGFNTDLLKELKVNGIKYRNGCSMHFIKDKRESYIGEVEPGNLCLICRGSELTYLKSFVEFNADAWKSLDQGFNSTTDNLSWGSKHGALCFKRIESYGTDLSLRWVKGGIQ